MRCSTTHLLGQGAGLLRGVEDFIVEDREVECQAQPDGVRGLHVLLADVESVLVGLLRVLHCICKTQSITAHFTLPPQPVHSGQAVPLWEQIRNLFSPDIFKAKRQIR